MNLPIEIASTDRDNAATFIQLGLGLTVLNLISHQLFLDKMAIANMFLYGFAVALVLLGYLKQGEPKIKYKLTELGLFYYHRKTELFLPWSNIQRIDQPKQNRLSGGAEYDYIGIKMKEPEAFYDDFPLRLASRLLTEQRQLWLAVAGSSCSTGQCVPEDFIDSIEVKLKSGTVYKGLIAMFVHRCETLHEQLGFHLYLPLTGIEISSAKLLNLLRETKNTSLQG